MRKAIAIDFDGCLCTNAYPEIGEPIWPVIYRARAEQQAGAGLILWTCREDQLLLDAIATCERWGLTFDAVNESLPDWIETFKTRPRKVGASEYWDDKAAKPTTLNGTYVSMEWFDQVNAELQAYKRAEAEKSRPLTLEELREMSLFDWLWIEMVCPSKRQVFRKKESAYYQVFEDYTNGDALCCGWPGLIHEFEYEDYGKTWMAYRHKPEEGTV